MKSRKMARPPIELLIASSGYLLYAVAGFMPQLDVPSSPFIAFVTGAAWLLMVRPDRKWYWFTLTMALLEMLAPTWDRIWITIVDKPSDIEVYCVFIIPTLLFLLLLSPRVRRYVSPPR